MNMIIAVWRMITIKFHVYLLKDRVAIWQVYRGTEIRLKVSSRTDMMPGWRVNPVKVERVRKLEHPGTEIQTPRYGNTTRGTEIKQMGNIENRLLRR